MLTIYTVAYNEEVMLPFFIKHYKERFVDCKIVLMNNLSTDNTREIAIKNNCDIIEFNSDNKISDSAYLNIKNNIWKNSETNWVLVCDVDEFLEIDLYSLIEEEKLGITIIKGTAYDMINSKSNFIDIENMNLGVRNYFYDKCLLFNKKYITEINYSPGCHSCNPTGCITYNKNEYKLYHNSYVEEEYKINRYANYKLRLSQENINQGWGIQYNLSKDEILNDFKTTREKAIKIR